MTSRDVTLQVTSAKVLGKNTDKEGTKPEGCHLSGIFVFFFIIMHAMQLMCLITCILNMTHSGHGTHGQDDQIYLSVLFCLIWLHYIGTHKQYINTNN